MIKLELTEQEAGVLQQLLDIATKAGGLQVAEAALVFAKRIGEAVQATKQVTPPAQQASAAEAEAPTA